MLRGKYAVMSVLAGLLLATMFFSAQEAAAGQEIQVKSHGSPFHVLNQNNLFSVEYQNSPRKGESPFSSEEGRLLREFAAERLVPLLSAENAHPSGIGSEAAASSYVDLDNNGVDDVVVDVTAYDDTGAVRNSRIMARRGTDGSVLWEKRFPGARAMTHSIMDFDGDGRNDLLVWIIKRASNHAVPLSIIRAVRGYDGADLWEAGGPGAVVFGRASGDFDGDGKPDVFLRAMQFDRAGKTEYSSLIARRGYDGLVLWEEKALHATISGSPTGDLDGDGKSDAFVQLELETAVTKESRVWFIAKRVHDGATLWKDAYRGLTVRTSLSEDLDGDGKMDVLLRITRHDGEGNIVTEKAVARRGHDGAVLWQRKFLNRQFSAYSAGDLDGDGKTDVLFMVGEPSADTSDKYEKILALQGATGTVLWKQVISGGTAYLGSNEDLDGDGKQDVLLSLNTFDESGVGSLGRALAIRGCDGAHLWEEKAEKAGLFANAAGDLNEDRKPDVLVVNMSFDQSSGSPKLKLGARQGQDGAPLWDKRLLTGRNPAVHGYGMYVYTGYDLNGGADDLVVSLNVLGKSSVLFGKLLALQGLDGSNLWSQRIEGSELAGRPAGDLDGDGKADVVSEETRLDEDGQIWFSRITALDGDDGAVLWNDRYLRSDLSPLGAGDLDGQ